MAFGTVVSTSDPCASTSPEEVYWAFDEANSLNGDSQLSACGPCIGKI